MRAGTAWSRTCQEWVGGGFPSEEALIAKQTRQAQQPRSASSPAQEFAT